MFESNHNPQIEWGLWYWNDPPYRLIGKLCWGGCKCSTSPIEFNNIGRAVCKVCRKYWYTMLRQCEHCETLFINEFSHPNYCSIHPMCWTCCENQNVYQKGCTRHHEPWFSRYAERIPDQPKIPPAIIPRVIENLDWENDKVEEFVL